MGQRARPDRSPAGPCPRRAAAPPPPPAADRARSRRPRSAPRARPRPPPRRVRVARTRAGDPGRAGGRRPPPARAPSSGRWYSAAAAPGSGRSVSRGMRRRCVQGTGSAGGGCGLGRHGLLAPRRGSHSEMGDAGDAATGSAGRADETDAPSARTIDACRREGRRSQCRRGRSGSTRGPARSAAARAWRVGWPYGLPAPAEAIATPGRTVSTNACVVAVRLP